MISKGETPSCVIVFKKLASDQTVQKHSLEKIPPFNLGRGKLKGGYFLYSAGSLEP